MKYSKYFLITIMVLMLINSISELSMFPVFMSTSFAEYMTQANMLHFASLSAGTASFIGWFYLIVGIFTLLVTIYFFSQRKKQETQLHQVVKYIYLILNILLFIVLIVTTGQFRADYVGLITVPILYIVILQVYNKYLKEIA